jgi:nucleotide-binding universal stress UspA family protein
VALDLSEASEAILGPVEMLAWLSGAELTVIYVATSRAGVSGFETAGPMELPLPGESLADYAGRRLRQLAGVLRARSLRVTTRVVVAGNAAEGLLGAFQEDEYDLIALTTHGAGGLRRALLGSVADKVVRGATKPVLVLRPPIGTETAGHGPARQTPNG